jgi:hypothetical protein
LNNRRAGLQVKAIMVQSLHIRWGEGQKAWIIIEQESSLPKQRSISGRISCSINPHFIVNSHDIHSLMETYTENKIPPSLITLGQAFMNASDYAVYSFSISS